MMRRLAVFVLMLVVGCSPAETSGTSTTSSTMATTSTTPISTTSTSAPTTTTTTALAATTTSLSTTTTLGPTTTTSLAGNWAAEPLIVTDFGALGWWDGANWVTVESQGALPVSGGENYQVTVLGSLDFTTAGPQILTCDPLELVGVELADPELLGEYPGPYGVAISASWEVVPHLVTEASDDGSYSGFAAALLADRGLDVASPVIKQVVRTDLEGDGINEVIVVAEEVTPGLILEPGDYSLLFLRKVVDGQVQTAVLEETVVLDESGQFLGAHTVGTVADLNGDDKMEIVTDSAFFEGFAVSVWEYVNDDLGPTRRLQIGCGS